MSVLAPHRLHVRSRTGRVWHIRVDSGEKRLLATLPSAADPILDERDGRRHLIVPDSKAGRLVFIPLSP